MSTETFTADDIKRRHALLTTAARYREAAEAVTARPREHFVKIVTRDPGGSILTLETPLDGAVVAKILTVLTSEADRLTHLALS